MRSRFWAWRQQQHVGVAARADERERTQQMAVGEVLAGGDELALVGGAPFVVEPPPGGVDLEEGVLDEVADGHENVHDRRPKPSHSVGLGTTMRAMRIALVSPYSWTYPGGVTRHIGALAERFLEDGHHVRVLAPYDPPDRTSAVLHRGARPQPLEAPPWLVPLGRTVGFKANGAVSNISITPHGVAALHRELRIGQYDVVHIHEPVVPLTAGSRQTGPACRSWERSTPTPTSTFQTGSPT